MPKISSIWLPCEIQMRWSPRSGAFRETCLYHHSRWHDYSSSKLFLLDRCIQSNHRGFAKAREFNISIADRTEETGLLDCTGTIFFTTLLKIKNMQTIEKELLELKDQALKATKERDGAFYNNYLSDDAIAIVPYGVFHKEQIVGQMASSASSFKSVSHGDVRVKALNNEAGLVIYKATYEPDNKPAYSVFVTTVYAKINGKWKGVFYQQTPMQGA